MANDGENNYVDWYNEYLFETEYDLEEWDWLGVESEASEEIEREEPEETEQAIFEQQISEAIETIAPHWLYP